MPSGTVLKAEKDEVVQLEQGTFQRWKVDVDSEGKTVQTNILRKPDSSDPTGKTVEQQANGRWKVAQQNSGPSGSTGKSYEADPKKLRSENARSALHAACGLVNSGKLDMDQLGAKTTQFYAYIEKHAQVDS